MGSGEVSEEQAKLHAETEFEKYRIIQERLFMSDYDKYLLELLDKHHDLKNRYLHLEYHSDTGEKTVQSAGEDISKGKKCTLNCTLDELVLLKIIKQEPTITQKELALKVGKSERTIKKRTIELQEKGYIRRLNGKRNGRWEVLCELM